MLNMKFSSNYISHYISSLIPLTADVYDSVLQNRYKAAFVLHWFAGDKVS
jgi:hypothetical protein